MEYRFQSYLSVRINAHGAHQYDRYFENEYARINQVCAATTVPDHRVTLEIVKTLPDDLPATAIRRKSRFKRLFTFEYAVVGAGTPDVTIFFKDHPVSRIYVTAVGVFLQAHILEPLMYLSFLKQGVLFMHSAGVSKDGCAYLFPAYGGTGKTTTCMRLLSRGYGFLGDDLIIVDPKAGLAYPYPRPLHIFTYNVGNLQGAKIPFRVSALVYFKNALRFILEGLLRIEFLISTRVHADKILPDFQLSEPATLHNIIFLKKEGESQTISLDNDTIIKENAEIIVRSADLNVSLFDLLDDASKQSEIEEMEIRVASEMLQKADYFGFLNTRKIDLDKLETYLSDVETTVKANAAEAV